MSTSTALVKASPQVIKIMSDTDIVINRGTNDNVKKGDTFDIVGKGRPVIEPCTGNDLGSLDIYKDTVTVVVSYEEMCICNKIAPAPISVMFSSIMHTQLPGRYMLNDRIEPLSVDSADISDVSEDKVIRIGDRVIHHPAEEALKAKD